MASVTLCVRMFVYAVKGNRLELSTPSLVGMCTAIAPQAWTLTSIGQKVEGQD